LSALDIVRLVFAGSIIPKTMTCHKFSMQKLWISQQGKFW